MSPPPVCRRQLTSRSASLPVSLSYPKLVTKVVNLEVSSPGSSRLSLNTMTSTPESKVLSSTKRSYFGGPPELLRRSSSRSRQRASARHCGGTPSRWSSTGPSSMDDTVELLNGVTAAGGASTSSERSSIVPSTTPSGHDDPLPVRFVRNAVGDAGHRNVAS